MLLPLQLLFAHLFSRHSVSHIYALLRRDIGRQLRYYLGKPPAEPLPSALLWSTLCTILVLLTIALTVPSVSWFLAVLFTSMANITTIYNTFSLWALVFSVYFLNEEWSYLQAMAVLLGIAGVAMSTYGSAARPAVQADASSSYSVSPALFGYALSLLGAVSMAGYEVLYKRLTVIPHSTEGAFQPLPSDEAHVDDALPETEEALPFGVHAMAMMSGIGLATCFLFWLPILVAHAMGLETLEMPGSWTLIGWIAISILCGVLFNGCFAILLSLWGPVLASMSCLSTTVMVQVTDIILGVPFSWLSVAGNLVITMSFLCMLPW
ncbi:hypothetical protein MNAN1_000828 [Malassezia nana]|uniref:EamA domain-containing protein n=1 Tax=Malassezia nana TaxID=180528 RepID=A0AAF0ENA3_9BASI|nr:hypothetical protein MNAN1_000828 [Malassezia nana]